METYRNRKYLWAGVALVALLGGTALVFASVPHTFATGETLTADNLNGNFTALDQRMAALEGLLPAGTIIAFGGSAVGAADGGAPASPAGWLLCDGSAVSRTTYATLFAAIGINFGGGDGIGTFNLPDLRGRFLRGADHGAGRDPNAAARTASNTGGPSGDVVGSLEGQATALPAAGFTAGSAGAHSHTYSTLLTATDTDRGVNSSTWSIDNTGTYTTSTDGAHTHAISGGDSETRPKNVAVNYLIKL